MRDQKMNNPPEGDTSAPRRKRRSAKGIPSSPAGKVSVSHVCVAKPQHFAKFMSLKGILLPVLTALLLLLGFPPFDLFLAPWFALVPFFLAVRHGAHWKNALKGLLSGTLFFALLIWWLNYVTTIGYVLLVLYLGLYFAFASWFLGLFRSNALRALVLSPLWVSLEFFRSSGIFGFSWGLLGHTQYRSLPTIQIASSTGVYGISALLAATSAALGYWFLQRCEKRCRFRALHAVIVVVVLVHLFGLWALSQHPEGTPLKVGLLQGNVPQLLKWEPNMEDPTIKLYTQMTHDALARGAELVVWPETAVPDVLDWKPDWENQFKQFCAKERFNLLFGALHHDVDAGRYFNSAYYMTPESASAEHGVQRYDKMRLVPFGEYVPFRNLLPFVQEVVESEGGGLFSGGVDLTVFQAGRAAFSTLICFESTLPSVARVLVQNGARALVVLTNDEWFGRTPASLQHGLQSVFRAVENRVPVVRATNTGWTCSIDTRGRILATVPRFEEGILVDNMPVPDRVGTVYTRWGDWFAWLCVVVVTTMAALTLKKQRVKR